MAWDILYLPAILDDGAALWPEVFPLPRLEDIKRQMGSPLFKCMFMGDPAGLTGEVFQPHWFGLASLRIDKKRDGTDGYEQVLVVDGRDEPLTFDKLLVYQFWDLAISEKETADYTVGLTLALYPEDMSMCVIDVVRDHLSFEKTQRAMALAAERWKPHAIGIESIAYQAAAVQQARNHLLFPVQEVRVDRDKVTRARLPAALAEQGKLSVVRGVWTDAFLDEVSTFPSGQHDDIVDALSGAAALAQAYVPSSFFLWN